MKLFEHYTSRALLEQNVRALKAKLKSEPEEEIAALFENAICPKSAAFPAEAIIIFSRALAKMAEKPSHARSIGLSALIDFAQTRGIPLVATDAPALRASQEVC